MSLASAGGGPMPQAMGGLTGSDLGGTGLAGLGGSAMGDAGEARPGGGRAGRQKQGSVPAHPPTKPTLQATTARRRA